MLVQFGALKCIYFTINTFMNEKKLKFVNTYYCVMLFIISMHI